MLALILRNKYILEKVLFDSKIKKYLLNVYFLRFHQYLHIILLLYFHKGIESAIDVTIPINTTPKIPS